MLWVELTKYFAGVSVIGGIIAYLGKVLIEAVVAGKIEEYKFELERLTKEKIFKFERLHTERAEIVKEYYSRLVAFDSLLASTLHPFQSSGELPLTEKVGALATKFNELNDYFSPRRIYFQKSLSAKIDKLMEKSMGIFFDITTFPVDTKNQMYIHNPDGTKERAEYWKKARLIHENEVRAVKLEIEDAFQKILGIENE